MVMLRWLAVLGTLVSFSSQTYAQRYFVESRVPSVSWFAYAGLDWSRLEKNGPDSHAKVLEARLVLPSQFEFSVRGQEIRKEIGTDTVTDFGDTTVSVIKAIRNVAGMNYLSFEYGEVIATAPRNLRSGIDDYTRVRVLFGPTVLSYDVSVTAIDLSQSAADQGGSAYVTSFGLRSQWRQFHWGLNANVRAQSGVGPSSSADFVAMYRRANGSSLYAILGSGMSGDDDSNYASFGYELRF